MPEGHIVSLGDPELVILVNIYKVRINRARFSTCPTINLINVLLPTLFIHPIFQGVGGLSVVPKYETLRRYNVTQLVNVKDLDGLEGGVLSRIT